MFLPVTETGRVPVTPQGQPVFLAEPTGDIVVTAGAIHAFLLGTEAAERLGALRDAPSLTVSATSSKPCT